MGLCKIWLLTVESSPGGVGLGVFLLGIGAGPPPAELGVPAALTWLLWVAELSLQQRPTAGRPTGPASRREARSPAQAGAQDWLPGPGRGQASKEREQSSAPAEPNLSGSGAEGRWGAPPKLGHGNMAQGSGRTRMGNSSRSKEGAGPQGTGPSSGRGGTPGRCLSQEGPCEPTGGAKSQTVPALVSGHSAPHSDCWQGNRPGGRTRGRTFTPHTRSEHVLSTVTITTYVRAVPCQIAADKLCLSLTGVSFCSSRKKMRCGKCHRVSSFI